MKKKTLIYRVCRFITITSLIASCSFLNPRAEQEQRITLISYNTQTFFDSVEDGTEFADFKGSDSHWSEQKYRTRLTRLKEVLYVMGENLSGQHTLPDIVVLQEIENQRVIEDFCKQLPQHDSYPYAFYSPPQETGYFSTAVLSKYPIEDFRIYTLQTVQESYAATLRPLTEILINTGSQDKKNLIKIFSVHWKSKRGKSNGNAIRILQEEQLIQKIADTVDDSTIPFIACGDFNQESCTGMQQFSVCWDLLSHSNEQAEEMQPSGSYFFRDKWEKIDHIFYINADSFQNGIEVQKFSVPYDEPLVQNGKPARYDVRTGQGYSDHLPIGIRFKLP